MWCVVVFPSVSLSCVCVVLCFVSLWCGVVWCVLRCCNVLYSFSMWYGMLSSVLVCYCVLCYVVFCCVV